MGRPKNDNYNYIRVHQASNTQIQIYSKSEFFYGNVVFKQLDDRLIIRRVGIDYEGKTHAVTYCKDGFHKITVLSDLPHGKYFFDEDESNEDMAVIYYKEQLQNQ